MQIPFEFDPPKKDEDSSLKSKESELPDSEDTISLQAKKPLTVTQLTRQITLLLEGEFRSLAVEGELSNVKKAASGHWYFSLKDDQSQIRCAMFRNIADNLRFDPEDGLEVVVRGHLTVYQQRGDYQIKVSYMEPKGLGALQLAYEQLKSRLEAEGLFDQQYKRALPFLPRRIGIVTSPKGAVIHDMLTVLERRFPGIPVLLFPSQVQGNSAPKMLVEGIRHLNTLRDSQQIDVLIVGRGGGSIEDLWAFNNESLAREMFNFPIPIISGIGHEIDFTISDFVADLRAPTPTAAAELVTEFYFQLPDSINDWMNLLLRSMEAIFINKSQAIVNLSQNLKSPSILLKEQSQSLDNLEIRLSHPIKNLIVTTKQNLKIVASQLSQSSALRTMERYQELLYKNLQKLQYQIKNKLENKKFALEKINTNIKAVSPLDVLDRGYAIVMDNSGNALKSTKNIKVGDTIHTRLSKGTIKSNVTKKD